MMVPDGVAIYVANRVVDMRKAIDGLALLVTEHFERNPCDGAWYVFFNRRHNKVKCLYYDRNGFVLWYKRLEKGRFVVPSPDADVYQLQNRQFRWLLDGLDCMQMKGHSEHYFEHFG